MAYSLVRTNFRMSMQKDFYRSIFLKSDGIIKSTLPCLKEDVTQVNEIISQPYKYIARLPGREIRKTLSRTFNYWLAISEQELGVIEEVGQKVHNTSLLLDDIQDSSVLRRGVPAAHLVYGIPSTLSTVIYSFFRTLEEVMILGNIDAVKIFVTEIVDLYRGQGMEIYWRENLICPTEDEYKRMVIRKTGAIFRMEIYLMQLFSDKKFDFSRLLEIMSISFQICNDYENLHYTKGTDESYCTDISEGNFSFPLIHAIQMEPKNSKVMYIMRQKSTDLAVKKYCASLLEEYGSFEYTRNVIHELKIEAIKEVEKLGGNPHFEDILAAFFDISKYN